MRRSEITKELIDLSKQAKELGFPQDVESGDYVCINFDKLKWQPQLFGGDMEIQDGQVYFYSTDEFYSEWHTILSFSRCLEWLNKEKYGVALGFNTFIWDTYIFFVGTQSSRAKTHHEAIAKAVVKILEGEDAK